MDYAALIGLGIQIFSSFLGQTKDKLPTGVAAAIAAAIEALQTHHNDVITKASLDAQRG